MAEWDGRQSCHGGIVFVASQTVAAAAATHVATTHSMK